MHHLDNQVTIIGRVATKFVERTFDGGSNTVWFKVAVNRPESRERREAREAAGKPQPCDFIPVKAWNGTAKALVAHRNVGDEVAVLGSIEAQGEQQADGTWKDFPIVVNASSVKFLRRKGEGVIAPADTTNVAPEFVADQGEAPASVPAGEPSQTVSDDDIPF